MKTIICIVARTNSTRLPQKTILDIAGRKMVEHIIASMKKVQHANAVYLCTSVDEEDAILIQTAKKNGIQSYAGSRDSVISRLLSVAEIEMADNIVRVTGDNIFTDPIFLEFALDQHIKNDADYTRVEKLPLGVTGEIMKVSALKDCYQKVDPDKSEYLTVYMFQPQQYRCVTILPPLKFQMPFYTLTVDTPEDWNRTNYIYQNIEKETICFEDIYHLYMKKDIPHFKMTGNENIKLPDDEIITYRDYRQQLDDKISNSILTRMEDDDYEKIGKSYFR